MGYKVYYYICAPFLVLFRNRKWFCRTSIRTYLTAGSMLLALILVFNLRPQNKHQSHSISLLSSSDNYLRNTRGILTFEDSAHLRFVRKLLSSVGVSQSTAVVLQHDLDKKLTDDNNNWTCVNTSTVPSVPICVYNPQEDKFVSAQLLSSGVWERDMTKLFQWTLSKYPSSTIIDLGANIGAYTLLAARLGHRVVAVEPMRESVLRLQKGAQLAKTTDNILMIPHAISDTHELVTFRYQKGNKGGTSVRPVNDADVPAILKRDRYGVVSTVTLDDLSPLVNTTTTIIKMDIEGYECKAMGTSKRFFDEHFVPYVFMEWENMFRNRHRYGAACNPSKLQWTADNLAARGYHPIAVQNGHPLDPQASCSEWRIGDVVWRHTTAPRLPIER